MNEHHDDDGDSIVLTDYDRQHIQEEAAAIDAEIRTSKDLPLIRELGRRQRHLADELQAGHRLPLPEGGERYDYEIVPREAELGGGWRLYLIEDGKEVGGGVFPAPLDAPAGGAWWDGLDKDQRVQWLARAKLPTAADAYVACLQDEAWHDAVQAAGEWVESHQATE